MRDKLNLLKTTINLKYEIFDDLECYAVWHLRCVTSQKSVDLTDTASEARKYA